MFYVRICAYANVTDTPPEPMLLQGTMADGPWSYRIGSVLFISPIYACVRSIITVVRKHNSPHNLTLHPFRPDGEMSLTLTSTCARKHYSELEIGVVHSSF